MEPAKIYQYLETLGEENQIKLVKSIIKEYRGYCAVNGLTRHDWYYNGVADNDPGKALEHLTMDISELKSVEQFGNKYDNEPYLDEILSDIEEKFIPEDEWEELFDCPEMNKKVRK